MRYFSNGITLNFKYHVYIVSTELGKFLLMIVNPFRNSCQKRFMISITPGQLETSRICDYSFCDAKHHLSHFDNKKKTSTGSESVFNSFELYWLLKNPDKSEFLYNRMKSFQILLQYDDNQFFSPLPPPKKFNFENPHSKKRWIIKDEYQFCF